jgi:phage/plasmid primase-like uncharacterized protein
MSDIDSRPEHVKKKTPSRNGFLTLSEAQRQFADYIASQLGGDAPSPGKMIADGKWRRFKVAGDKRGETSGEYFQHSDAPFNGFFKDHRRQIDGHWRADIGAESKLSPAERAAQIEAERLRNEKTAREREAAYDAGAVKAEEAWNAAKPAPATHAYLKKKGVQPHGIRIGADGRLVVPVYSKDGKLQTVQFISRAGKKLYLKGGALAGGHFILGEITEATERVLVAEGFATAGSLHEATGYPVIVAFDAGNLVNVALWLRQRHPNAIFVICADDDKWKPDKGNTGIREGRAAAEMIGAVLAIPDFTGIDGEPTDFNDLAVERGLAEVSRQINAAIDAWQAAKAAAEAEAQKPVSPSWAMPTATAREAARASDAAIKAFMQGVRAGYPVGSPPPQIGIGGEMASGKTKSTTLHGITEILGGMPDGRIAIFLPGHIQTGDVARRFEDAADELADAFDGEAEAAADALAKLLNNRYGRKMAHVWRGSKQPDPDKANYEKPPLMCPLAEQGAQVEIALGDFDKMCRNKNGGHCDLHPKTTFSPCGRQKQKDAARDPQNRIWIFPHVMLGKEMPAEFNDLPPWSAVVIDEAPWSNLVGGCNSPYKLIVAELSKLGEGDFKVEYRKGDPTGFVSNDRLKFIRDSLCAAIGDQDSGWLLANSLRTEGLTAAECSEAEKLIWRLKWDTSPHVEPNWTLERAAKKMEPFQRHNGLVGRMAKLFKQLAATLNDDGDKSPYLKFAKEVDKKAEGDVEAVYIGITWKVEIDESWTAAPILYLDGTMQPERARLWLPRLEVTSDVKAAMPAAVYIRQVHDRAVSHKMIKPDPKVKEQNQKTRKNNAIAAARVLEVKAAQFDGRGAYVDAVGARIDGLAVMPKGTEDFIRAAAPVPGNFHLGHHNNLRGVNLYSRVAYTAGISRPLPSPAEAERIAWTETGRVGQELDSGADYPTRTVGRLMRDGTGRAAKAAYHPEPAAERVRWATCEGELLQNIARPRPIWRTPETPLLIDIITSVPLPLPIDELITWDAWKAEGGPIELLEARGIILGDGRDMAAFASGFLPEEWESPGKFEDWRDHGGQTSLQAWIEVVSRITRNRSVESENSHLEYYTWEKSDSTEHFVEPRPHHLPRKVYSTFAVFVAKRRGAKWAQIVAIDLAKHQDPKAVLEKAVGPLASLQIVYLPLEAALAYLRANHGTRDFDIRASAALAIYRMADVEGTVDGTPDFVPIATRHFRQFKRPVALPNGWVIGAKLPAGTKAAARRFVDEIALLSSPGTIDAVIAEATKIDATAKQWLPGLIAAWRRNRTETKIEPARNGRLDVNVMETQTWIDDAGNTHQGRAPLTQAEVSYMKRRRDPNRPVVIRSIDNGAEEWHVIDPAAHRREIEAMTDAEILAAAGGDHVHGDRAALAKELRAYASRSPAHAREIFLLGRWPKEAA